MWRKKVLGLYVVVSELFARSECLVYLFFDMPHDTWREMGARGTDGHLLLEQASEQGSTMALLSAYRP